jgi:hypothetical protein
MFFAGPGTLQNALNLATSLYHFHEWLYIEFRNGTLLDLIVQKRTIPLSFTRNLSRSSRPGFGPVGLLGRQSRQGTPILATSGT